MYYIMQMQYYIWPPINTNSLRYQNFPKNLKKNKTQLSGLRALKVSNIYAPFATLAQYKGFKLFIFVET
jgi:hypothetical protein